VFVGAAPFVVCSPLCCVCKGCSPLLVRVQRVTTLVFVRVQPPLLCVAPCVVFVRVAALVLVRVQRGCNPCV